MQIRFKVIKYKNVKDLKFKVFLNEKLILNNSIMGKLDIITKNDCLISEKTEIIEIDHTFTHNSSTFKLLIEWVLPLSSLYSALGFSDF